MEALRQANDFSWGALIKARAKLARLRVDPWTLRAKTDDYAGARTVGGPIAQRYWNGRAELALRALPLH